MLLVFLDSEATGLNPRNHRLLDIAFKVVDSLTGQVVATYESIIAQPEEIFNAADPESLKINGFTYEMTLQGKPEKSVAADIIENLNNCAISKRSGVFICQNPSFDRPFFCQLIDSDLQDTYHWPYHWLDLASMFFAIRLINDKWSLKTLKEKGLSKDNIANFFHLPPEERPHRAINGVNHLIACYEAMFGPFQHA